MNGHAITLFVLVATAAIFMGILAHEATHLVLATEAKGICLGVCEYYNPAITAKPTGYSLATAFGVHNEASQQEFLPSIVQLVATGIISFIGGKAIVLHKCA